LLEVRGLSVAYGLVEAVRGLNLRVARGSVVSLVGPNGAGKTTTLNALSGVVPLAAGAIALDGKDITRVSSHRRVAEGLVQVPEGRLVLAGMSVRENLELGAYRRPKQEVAGDMARMEELFPILAEKRETMAGSLSGGEQQMLAMARGLMARPRLLLLDEPSLGLAPLVVKMIFAIVKELKDQGQTILLVEQNVHQSLAVSDYAYVMESGSVVLEGPAAELACDPAVARAYLGQA
jgi:branched-chain amino acid transport system ATP-binding protein